MNVEAAREWVKKADEDWTALERLVAGGLLDDVAGPVAFHAQQCAEKYLKACLAQEEDEPPRTHDLSLILDVVVSHFPALEPLALLCDEISPYAVLARYPGFSVTADDATAAAECARKVRASVREALGLPG